MEIQNRLDCGEIGGAWLDTHDIVGAYSKSANDPLKSLLSGKSNCLSFALVHYALALPQDDRRLGLSLFRAQRINSTDVHFFNSSIGGWLPGILYDCSMREFCMRGLADKILVYHPEDPEDLGRYYDFMKGVIPGETHYGERVEVGGCELTYCNPEYVLGIVCSTEGLTMNGLACAAKKRLQRIN